MSFRFKFKDTALSTSMQRHLATFAGCADAIRCATYLAVTKRAMASRLLA
jgi:hypothetical protein